MLFWETNNITSKIKEMGTRSAYLENSWCCNEVWDMLPQNMATWHTECFKLRESENWDVQDELSDLPLNQIVMPSHKRCPPYMWRKGVSLSRRTKGHREESEWMGFAQGPPDNCIFLRLLALVYLPWLSSLHQTSHKNTQN